MKLLVLVKQEKLLLNYFVNYIIKKSENLGDVRNVSAKDLDVDLLVFGSPCQSFTRAGKQGGGLKGSDTRSALMWEAVRIMEECKPKWIVWENVPDAISRKTCLTSKIICMSLIA